MELKIYQRRVLDDLSRFLNLYVGGEALYDAKGTYDAYFKEMGFTPGGRGADGVPKYHDDLGTVPRVCIKVPTGGGKTFLGVNAVKRIFDALPSDAKTVVWLVPRNEILSQTLRQFRDPNHFTRMTLNRDFMGRVEVLDKEDGLVGRNFSIGTVYDQLNFFVLSFDSFKNRDGMRAFRENSSLVGLAEQQKAEGVSVNIDDADDTALISVLAGLNPIVIVDESHHARSKLSIDMLKNLNPRFVLELTATPSNKSNVITQATARDLKREEMVKLPVIVYRRGDKGNVIMDAISLQRKLEGQALANEKVTGDYIRPIVLFQAERRGDDEAETFGKLKKRIVEKCGVPEDQVAIRTGEVNELKGVNLLSRDCQIRFVITVDALAEGWDCPFAYILATVANKNSAVSVEQIVGRVLRQPYVKRAAASSLNASYVLTSSADFNATLDQVVSGLNGVGFAKDDVVSKDAEEVIGGVQASTDELQQDAADAERDDDPEDYSDLDLHEPTVENVPGDAEGNDDIDGMLSDAEELEGRFERDVAADSGGYDMNAGFGGTMNTVWVAPVFVEYASTVRMPMYEIDNPGGNDLFDLGGWTLFDSNVLLDDFKLSRLGTDGIEFNAASIEDIRAVDVTEDSDRYRILQVDAEHLRSMRTLFDGLSEGEQKNSVVAKTLDVFPKQFVNKYGEGQLKGYLARVVDDFSFDEIGAAFDSPRLLMETVRNRIEAASSRHRRERFEKLQTLGKIRLKADAYELPEKFTLSRPSDAYQHSLYTSEEECSDTLERKMVDGLSNCPNIRWWHRVVERRPDEFHINGFINHYPDFLAQTMGGKILVIETKGGHLTNANSADKLAMGRQWSDKAGDGFEYFMVFDQNAIAGTGSYTFAKFSSSILPGLS